MAARRKAPKKRPAPNAVIREGVAVALLGAARPRYGELQRAPPAGLLSVVPVGRLDAGWPAGVRWRLVFGHWTQAEAFLQAEMGCEDARRARINTGRSCDFRSPALQRAFAGALL